MEFEREVRDCTAEAAQYVELEAFDVDLAESRYPVGLDQRVERRHRDGNGRFPAALLAEPVGPDARQHVGVGDVNRRGATRGADRLLHALKRAVMAQALAQLLDAPRQRLDGDDARAQAKQRLGLQAATGADVEAQIAGVHELAIHVHLPVHLRETCPIPRLSIDKPEDPVDAELHEPRFDALDRLDHEGACVRRNARHASVCSSVFPHCSSGIRLFATASIIPGTSAAYHSGFQGGWRTHAFSVERTSRYPPAPPTVVQYIFSADRGNPRRSHFTASCSARI